MVLAGSFHFLANFVLGGSRLRIGVSDFLLPVFLLVVLWRMYSFGRLDMHWRIRRVGIWLSLLSGWMLISLIIGYSHMGAWQTWAVVNKTLGWFMLVGYFLLGAILGANVDADARDRFVKMFLVVGWVVCAYEIAVFTLNYHGFVRWSNYMRPQGFFANPNAFGVALSSMIVIHAAYLRRRALFPPWVHRLGMALVLLALFLSASRSAWLGLIVALIFLTWLRALSLRELVTGVILATALGLFSLSIPWQTVFKARVFVYEATLSESDSTQAAASKKKSNRRVAALALGRYDKSRDGGLRHRIYLTRQALELWRENPVLGIGLGRFYWEQKRAESSFPPAHIHNTSLWLVTETGLIGAALFCGFFFYCLWKCVSSVRRGEREPFLVATIGILLVCAGASVGMEAMYQRYVWFFLGWALTLPASKRGDVKLT
tara:strand:- start:200 stop:1492 length:1293 start_codon:yes stop_codon:yes gene_type:complete